MLDSECEVAGFPHCFRLRILAVKLESISRAFAQARESSIAGNYGPGAGITVVSDAASVGSDAGSVRHEGTLIDAKVRRHSVTSRTKRDSQSHRPCLDPVFRSTRPCKGVVSGYDVLQWQSPRHGRNCNFCREMRNGL